MGVLSGTPAGRTDFFREHQITYCAVCRKAYERVMGDDGMTNLKQIEHDANQTRNFCSRETVFKPLVNRTLAVLSTDGLP